VLVEFEIPPESLLTLVLGLKGVWSILTEYWGEGKDLVWDAMMVRRKTNLV
jgi:hypothetical protein